MGGLRNDHTGEARPLYALIVFGQRTWKVVPR
jgi:hypothetical protein